MRNNKEEKKKKKTELTLRQQDQMWYAPDALTLELVTMTGDVVWTWTDGDISRAKWYVDLADGMVSTSYVQLIYQCCLVVAVLTFIS